jgi:hypothetical protein
VARNTWNAELWTGLLGAWRTPSLTENTWRRVLDLIEAHHEIGTAGPLATANFVEDAMDRKGISNNDVQRLEEIGDRLLAASAALPLEYIATGASIGFFDAHLRAGTIRS